MDGKAWKCVWNTVISVSIRGWFGFDAGWSCAIYFLGGVGEGHSIKVGMAQNDSHRELSSLQTVGTGSKFVPISCPKCDPKMMHHNQHDQGTFRHHFPWFLRDQFSIRCQLDSFGESPFSDFNVPDIFWRYWALKLSKVKIPHGVETQLFDGKVSHSMAKWPNFGWMSQQSIKHVQTKLPLSDIDDFESFCLFFLMWGCWDWSLIRVGCMIETQGCQLNWKKVWKGFDWFSARNKEHEQQIPPEN